MFPMAHPMVVWQSTVAECTYVSFTAYLSSDEAIITVNVYSPWMDRMRGFPLIGSLNDGAFTYGPPGTTESYSVLITLPDPMAFSATVPPTFTNSTAAVRELDFTFNYGNQHFNIPSVPNDGKVNVGYLDVAHVPPGTWWNVMDP